MVGPDKIDDEIRRITRYAEECTSYEILTESMIKESIVGAIMRRAVP
jgi:hypothetical protein